MSELLQARKLGNGRWHLLLLAVFTAVALIAGLSWSDDFVRMHLVNLWLLYTIATVGFYFVFGMGGRFAFCQPFMMALGGYTSALYSGWVGFWPGLAMALGTVFLVALVLAVLTIRAQAFYFAIATLGITEIGLEVFTRWGTLGGQNGFRIGIELPTVFGKEILEETEFFWLFLLVGIVVLLLGMAVECSPVRREALAAREREVVAEASGVWAKKLQVSLFVYGCVLGGLSGAFIGTWQGALSTETFGVDLSIAIFVAVILGGTGSMWGAVGGSALIVILPELLAEFEDYRTIVYGLILLVGVIALPQGVAGIVQATHRRATRSRAAPAADDGDPGPPAPAAPVVHVPSPVTAGPLLSAQDVSVRFGELRALDGLTLSVRSPGQIVGVVGPNGSGKSTFLNALSGVVPRSGVVTVAGRTVAGGRPLAAWKTGMSRAFQTPQNFADLTCVENVMVGCHDRSLTGFTGAWLRRRTMARAEARRYAEAMDCLRRVGLTSIAHVEASALTYGQQRLLELARALASRPSVLLLDEPAAGLNDAETDELAELLRTLGAEGIAIVLVEHKIAFIERLCESVVVLDAGMVIAEGTPLGVWQDARVVTAFLGEPHHA